VMVKAQRQCELKKKLYKGPSNHYYIAPFGFNQFSNGWKNYLFIFSYCYMLFVQSGCDLGFLTDTKKLNF
jgi:hypothetical protein